MSIFASVLRTNTCVNDCRFDYTAHFGLRHRYPQGRGGHGASLQPGGAGAVRNAGTYNTRENQAKYFGFKAVCVPGYIAYVLVCIYAINGAKGFVQGF